MRQDDGAWISGFAGFLGHTTVLHAELYLLLEGLLLAKNHGLSSIVCSLDSLEAMNLVVKDIPQYRKYATIVTSICDLIAENRDVSIEQSLQETNMCADFLSNFGV